VDVGGRSTIHTVWPSDAIYTPVTSAILCGQGDKGWFAGEKIEQAAMTKKITRPMIERNTPTNPNIARPTCRMLRTVEIKTLIDRRGGSILLGDAVARLRCRTCGSAPDWVQLAGGVRWRARQVRQMVLVNNRP
jgi:hypothetical protein